MNFVSLIPVTARHGGFLPHWLLFISVVSVFNSFQTYFSNDLTKKVYSQAPAGEISGLGVRTFGTWTLLTSIVRFYGAYHLVGNKEIYELCMWTFVVAGLHFNLEWLVFKNCRFDRGLLGPFLVSSVSIVWMLLQKEYYVLNV